MAVRSTSKTTSRGTSNKLSISVDDADIRAILKAFGKMDEIAKTDMKKVANQLADQAAQEVAAVMSRTKQGQIVADSIKVSRSDKAPSFTVGGFGRANVSGGAKYGELVMGVEFGGPTPFKNGGRRFAPRSPREGKGNKGYFIFPTLKRLQPQITKAWSDQVDRIRSEWRERIG